MGSTAAARLTLEPGWRWSECVKPVVGTESCQLRSRRRRPRRPDDRLCTRTAPSSRIAAGDAYVIEPGHDAWVVGDERFVGFEFESKLAEDYAKA